MKKFKSFKETENSNRVVKELNAVVLSATFDQKDGYQMADLYKSVHSANCLVSHKKCAPIHSDFVETVLITFN